LIGGGGHWITGERPRAVLADEAALLAGAWTIAAIDGRPPEGPRPAHIAFGPTGYSGSAGCNSFQGYQMAHRRRLFVTMPVSTEMGCGGTLGAQERRVTALLAAAPRIALGERGEIALVDEAGSLRLRRAEGADGWAPEGRLWTGAPLTAELTMLDAEPLRMRMSEPETRLRLTAQRFDIDSGCGRLGGIWRRQSAVPAGVSALEFLTDAEPDPEGACAGALAARLPVFKRLFNGPARVLIGASGELLVAGDRHWLGGRVLRPSRR
jgi:heat shock protein HslJ